MSTEHRVSAAEIEEWEAKLKRGAPDARLSNAGCLDLIARIRELEDRNASNYLAVAEAAIRRAQWAVAPYPSTNYREEVSTALACAVRAIGSIDRQEVVDLALIEEEG